MLLHDSVAHRPETTTADVDLDAEASSESHETVSVSMLEDMVTDADDRLWRRVLGGLAVGFLLVAALTFILMLVAGPELSLAGRLGVAAFIGFWSSPFVGFSAAVGYHQLTEEAH